MGKWSSLIMVSHNLSKILSSPFVVIDDKGGEVAKIGQIDDKGEVLT